MNRFLEFLIYFALLMAATAAADPGPRFGGTKPNLGLRLGDPNGFEVAPPYGFPKGQTYTGEEDMLIWGNLSEGYVLDTDIPLPSSWAGPYTLTINTHDGDGNPASRVVTINYAPAIIPLLTTNDATLNIPATAESFRDSAGRQPITTGQFVGSDGKPVTGSHKVYASLSATSTVSLRVGGVVLAPGAKNVVIGDYDFGADGTPLSLPLGAGAYQEIGEAHLLILTNAPHTPVVDVTVKTWKPDIALSAESWTINQGFDIANIRVDAQATSRCSIAKTASLSRNSDKLNSPVCYVEFQPKPSDLVPVADSIPAVAVTGRIWTPGNFSVGYKAYLVVEDGSKILVDSGTSTLQVIPTASFIEFRVERESPSAYRKVENVDARLAQSRGPACTPVTDDGGPDPRSTESRLICVISWREPLPTGIYKVSTESLPTIRGTFEDAGQQTIAYDVYLVTLTGNRVLASSGSFTYDVIDPIPPVISEQMLIPIRPDLYGAPVTGGYAGQVVASSAKAKVALRLAVNGATTDEGVYSPLAFQRTSIIRRSVTVPARTLWATSVVDAYAAYDAVPEINASRSFQVLSVPPEGIEPLVDFGGEDTVVPNTETVDVNVNLKNVYVMAGRPGYDYDPATFGQWRVRLAHQIKLNQNEPITDWAAAANGSYTFTIDPGAIAGKGYLRLVAEAELVSPVPEYQRTAVSSQSLLLSVVEGGAIEVDAAASDYITGPVPMRFLIRTVVRDQVDRLAIGNVIWELSSDGGQTWEEKPAYRTDKLRFQYTFTEKGKYQVRAHIINKFSGAETVTAPTLFWAFTVPRTKLHGPDNAFLGDVVSYDIDVQFKNAPVPAADLVTQWSFDRGVTWADGSQSNTATRDTLGSIQLWSRTRMVDAPDTDARAWSVARRGTNFRTYKAPRVGISGLRALEEGKSSQYISYARTAYPNMAYEVAGNWTLPDGSQPADRTLMYTPSAADRAAETIKLHYEAEYVGREGDRGVVDYPVRVWEYVWPQWSIARSTGYAYAPAEFIFNLRTDVSNPYIEGAVYNWSAPAGGTLLRDRSPTSKFYRFETPGTYRVEAAITDGRGNSGNAAAEFTLLSPPAFTVAIDPRDPDVNNRAPLTVTVRTAISGGHNDDRIISQRILVDGDLISGQTVTLDVGSHTIRAEGDSQMGYSFAGEKTVTVIANQKPTCSIEVQKTSSGWLYRAICSDPDGPIRRMLWTVAGEEQDVNTNQIRISRALFPTPPEVSFVAVDDLGLSADRVFAPLPPP